MSNQIESISFNEIIRELKLNDKVNFIAFAITIHQVNAIDVCIEKLNAEGITLKGYIILIPHGITGLRISPKEFYNENNNIKVKLYNGNFRHSNFIRAFLFLISSVLLNKSNKYIYIVWTKENYRWVEFFERKVKDRKVKFIIIDDGDGSYINRLYREILFLLYDKNFSKENNKRKCTRLIQTIIRESFEIFIHYILLFNKRIIDNRLFKKFNSIGKSKYYPQQDVLFYYEKFYKRVSESIPQNLPKLFENKVVICTECLRDNNIVDGDTDFKIIKKLVSELEKIKITPIVKLHPRELDVNKYYELGCIIYDDITYSFESLIAGTKIKPICTVGFYSSVLLNVNGIFGIPSLSLAKILKQQQIKYTLRNQLTNYIRRQKNNILFPDSIEQAINIIYKLNSQK